MLIILIDDLFYFILPIDTYLIFQLSNYQIA